MNLYSICILFLPFIHSSIIKSIGLKSSSSSLVSSPKSSDRRSCEDHDDDYVFVPVYVPNQSTHRSFTTHNQLPLILPNMFRMNVHNDFINLPHFISNKYPYFQHTIPVKNFPYYSTLMDNRQYPNQHIYDLKMKTFDQHVPDFTGGHIDNYNIEKTEFDTAEAERRPDVFEIVRTNSDYEAYDPNENTMKSNHNEIDEFSSNEFDKNDRRLPAANIYSEKHEKLEYNGKSLSKMPPLLVKKPVKSEDDDEMNHRDFIAPPNDYPDLKKFLSEYNKEIVNRPVRDQEKTKMEISEPSFDKTKYYKAEYDNAFNRQLDYTKLPARPVFRNNDPNEISNYDSQKSNQFEPNDYKMEEEGEEKERDKNFDFYEFDKYKDSENKDEDKFGHKLKNDEYNNYQTEDARTEPENYNDEKYEMVRGNNNDEYSSSKALGYELDKSINDDDEKLSKEEEAEKSVMYQYDSPAYTEYETKSYDNDMIDWFWNQLHA